MRVNDCGFPLGNLLLVTGSVLAAGWTDAAAGPAVQRSAGKRTFPSAIEADWTAQERRRGRVPESPEAVQDALTRAARLLDHLAQTPSPPDLGDQREAL